MTPAESALKILSPSASKAIATAETEGDAISTSTYYRVNWTIKARKDGWKDKVLDVGLNELIPDPVDATKPGKLRPIVDGANLPIKTPWPLNGEGRKKPKSTDKPAEVEFVPYKPADWNFRWTKAETWSA